ncbi:MAG TPA: glycerol kinase, partial [Acidimicrobiales bacterium]|nr:glycerol kinase [Acidimicrobiales bacterium]
MDLLLQLQADQIRVPVVRGDTAEATARGAAFLAGLASGVWSGLGQLRSLAGDGNSFAPSASQGAADGAYAGWLRAVARSRDLAG